MSIIEHNRDMEDFAYAVNGGHRGGKDLSKCVRYWRIGLETPMIEWENRILEPDVVVRFVSNQNEV